ncbi:5-bromo-4-chloroindolyl phosphate hydrolysis family protein [Roseobacter sp. HKCCA0434]|uniref:5-bromo-4-chloroindolyl phosphate hydrolysis family protein n=1 Tax=Roseobacter sp. HKCCA0434 TaxID=3079297 RepID=UPI002905D326|nr:5-bromo-4-chloroindolyl phosphate hydrolysis family protein [Roseobacter sp. HKCCA0434]
MAKRFGGEFSPGSGQQAGTAPRPALSGRSVRRWTARLSLVSLATLPMLLAGVLELGSGNAARAIGEIVSFALMASGIWLTREGLVAEDAFAARTVARPPRAPRKIAGAVAMGLGIAMGAAVGWQLGPLQGALYGLIAGAAHIAAFGIDPFRGKGTDTLSTHDRDRVAGAVDKAEALLRELQGQGARIRDRAVTARIDSFVTTARAMFRRIEEDPRDLASARRYLGVYLSGARDATAQFAELWARDPATPARADYLALLDDLESRFADKQATLIANDRTALDIEIEVLRDRLKQEGVRPRNTE